MSFSKAKFMTAGQQPVSPAPLAALEVPPPVAAATANLKRLDAKAAESPDCKAATRVPSQMNGMTPCTIISYAELSLGNALGEGAFARVLEAQYKTKSVAVKFYPYREGDSVKNELVVLTQVANDGFAKHPNLVGFYGAGYETTKCEYFLVLEHMPNKSLQCYLENLKGDLDWPTILKIAIGIAAGVVDMHAMDLINLDLKPGNVLLGDDKFEKIKLTDFGLTISVANSQGEIAGSLVWMAPEVVLGRPQQVSDVYSFGVVLLQMLAPAMFLKCTHHIKAYLWMHNIPKNIAELAQCLLANLKCSGVTPEVQKDFVENVVQKCIDADPAKRPIMKVVLEKLKQLQSAYLQKNDAKVVSALVSQSQFKPVAPFSVAQPASQPKLKPVGIGFGCCM